MLLVFVEAKIQVLKCESFASILYFACVSAYKVGWNRIIHGGIVDLLMGPDGQKSDEVYVLSLPAFRWFRANYTSLSPRMAHTCHATKTRQMILVGGTNPLYSSDYNANGDRGGEPQDPWDQGIGVFDMTALEFKDSYQSNTDPYEPPSAIQQFYDNRWVK